MRHIQRFAMLLLLARLCAPAASQQPTSPTETGGDALIAKAYRERLSNIQVESVGSVITLLADDTSVPRHQRFIVRLQSGQTLLIAHNVDIAPRIPSLKLSDQVRFNGEYEWNAKGGVIHWTHRDPARRHRDGWLRHKGTVYR